MLPHIQKRALHSTAQCLLRQKAPPLKIRAPIAPTAKNFEVSDDHPLWQFFHDKKYLRSYEDLDNAGRPWTIPELRRKSFDDLHSLWYTCLKERNVLAREIQVLQAEIDQPDQQFMTASDRVRETMWRIRHVLSERAHAQESAREGFPREQEKLLEEFKLYYLDASKEEDADVQEALKRLQFAVFGISEIIDENKVNKHFIQGIKFISNLKLERYAKDHTQYEELTPITDAGEALVVFHAEPTTESISESIKAVLEMRQNGVSVDRYDEIETIQTYLNKLLEE
jgi:large subunit ribosomal protein L47